MVTSSSSMKRGRPAGRPSVQCETFGTSTVCAGEKMLAEHGSRVSWWLTLVAALVGVILVGWLTEQLENNPNSQWGALKPVPWITPTQRSLGALVGMVLVLAAYSNYMVAMHKGHLEKYPGQYGISAFIRIALWVLFLYGLYNGGTIGSAFALYTLAMVTIWNVLTSHAYSPFHTWLTIVELVFIIFLIIWLSLSNVPVFPTP